MDCYQSNKCWKKKPIVVVNETDNNYMLIERIERFYRVHYSNKVESFSYYFPSSSATFLLIDFSSVSQSWDSKDGSSKSDEIAQGLGNFVSANVGPHIIYLNPIVDEFLIAMFYDLQRSVEVKNPGKVITCAFATSWKNAAKLMMEFAEKLSLAAMENELVSHEEGLNSKIIQMMVAKERLARALISTVPKSSVK